MFLLYTLVQFCLLYDGRLRTALAYPDFSLSLNFPTSLIMFWAKIWRPAETSVGKEFMTMNNQSTMVMTCITITINTTNILCKLVTGWKDIKITSNLHIELTWTEIHPDTFTCAWTSSSKIYSHDYIYLLIKSLWFGGVVAQLYSIRLAFRSCYVKNLRQVSHTLCARRTYELHENQKQYRIAKVKTTRQSA